jgi:hypothetical protein
MFSFLTHLSFFFLSFFRVVFLYLFSTWFLMNIRASYIFHNIRQLQISSFLINKIERQKNHPLVIQNLNTFLLIYRAVSRSTGLLISFFTFFPIFSSFCSYLHAPISMILSHFWFLSFYLFLSLTYISISVFAYPSTMYHSTLNTKKL